MRERAGKREWSAAQQRGEGGVGGEKKKKGKKGTTALEETGTARFKISDKDALDQRGGRFVAGTTNGRPGRRLQRRR